MATYQGKLFSKSPFYITEDGANGFTSEIEIRIWSGDINVEPVDATYIMSKQTLSSTTDKVTFEIAKIVESFFDHIANPNSITIANRLETVWVNIKSGGGNANRDETYLGLDGYSYFLEGINYQSNEVSLISERILYHYADFPITLPVHVDGNDEVCYIVYKKNNVTVATFDTLPFRGTNFSYDKILFSTNNSFLPGEVDEIEVQNFATTVLDTFKVIAGECSKYTPYLVSFINKFGAYQELTFSLSSKQRLTVRKDSFKRQTLDLSSGVPTYNTGRHVYKDFNASGREALTLNTNYIDESLNDTLGQLILSEAVWITVDGITSPVNVTTKTLPYKKVVNDGLINYSIDFELAYNKINNIY